MPARKMSAPLFIVPASFFPDRHGRGCVVNQVIEVVVDPRGAATVQTRGFAGGECREASKFLEQALGRPTSEQLTAEFYQGQTTGQQIQQSQ